MHRRARHERLGRDEADDARRGEELHRHRQDAHLRRLGGDALRHLPLDEHGDLLRRMCRFEEVPERRRGDLIGQVRHDDVRRLPDKIIRRDAQDVLLHDCHLWRGGVRGLEIRREALVEFDRDDAPRRADRLGECRRQDTEARPHLDHRLAALDSGGRDDLGQHVAIDEEVLAHPTARRHAEIAEDRLPVSGALRLWQGSSLGLRIVIHARFRLVTSPPAMRSGRSAPRCR